MLTLGRFKPAQGAINAFCLFVSIRGLIDGPLVGGALYEMLSGHTWAIYSFYLLLLVGCIVSMTGEIIQLKQPLIESSPEGIAKLWTGILIECAGCAIISVNLLAFAISFFYAPELAASRSVPYLFLGAGVFFRTIQACNDLFRIRRTYGVH